MQCNNFDSENSCCIFGQDFRPYFPWKCFGKVNAKLQTGLLFVQPWLIFSFPDTTFSKWQGLFCFSLVQNIKMHLSKIDLFRESHMKKRCLDQVRVRLANCPAVFLSYFHCGFVMKYSRRWEPSIRLSKMFEPFLWLEMTNLRAVFG